MDLELLKEKFYQLVAPSLPNEWDVEEALSALTLENMDQVEEIFAQIPAIWPVSHSLCFSYLSAAGPALCCLAEDELSLWVHSLLDRYETSGLHGAQVFMADVAEHFLRQIRGQGGLRLLDIRSRLQPYINGLAGREMPLVAADHAGTDGGSIYLPAEIGLFAEQEENFLLFKLIASFQWASLAAGTFNGPPDLPEGKKKAHPLERFFAGFSQPDAARTLYHLFETGRLLTFLRHELPGLMREAAPLLKRLPLIGDQVHGPSLFDQLRKGLLQDNWPPGGLNEHFDRAVELVRICRDRADSNQVSLESVRELMVHPEPLEGLNHSQPLIFQGKLMHQEMSNLAMELQSLKELKLIRTMTARLNAGTGSEKRTLAVSEGPVATGGQGADTALVVDMPEVNPHGPPPWAPLQIDADNSIATDQHHQALTSRTVDRSSSSTVGLAGQAMQVGTGGGGGESATVEGADPRVYDEWDYRRKGFRKNWCVVREKAIQPVQSSFIEQTLLRYRGQIRRLRHQFELMQTSERFIRRQREGNDIDLDSLVESLADIHAGRPPSDRVFIRLAREDRDIAVFFLVDMSNSTAGWIGQSIKEALVLICEAMEVLNDRYGIYGFSGMRRLRCEIFPVKAIDERYSRAVRERISAIGPREYTRMAPAIRHLTSLFSTVEAKIRLMIVLSDGKPEDYDDYKGDYAIEDTRHALLEAKARGIHPFCITIDRQAHEYMAHMYGEVNYIFIDKVKQLPARMSEIYRVLTS